MYFIYYCRGKKGIRGRQLIQHSQTGNLNWLSVSELNSRHKICEGSLVHALPFEKYFCCLHEQTKTQNLTLLLANDINSGFYFLLHVDLWVAEDFLLPEPFTI